MALYEAIARWIKEVPNYLKTQEMCNLAVRIEPCSLACVPDHFKTQEICTETVPMCIHTYWACPRAS